MQKNDPISDEQFSRQPVKHKSLELELQERGQPCFEATLFNDGLERGRGGGVLSVSSDGLILARADQRWDVPLVGLKLGLGGSSDRLIFVSHPDCPEIKASVKAHGLLELLSSLGDDELQAQVKAVTRHKAVNFSINFGTVATIIGVIVALILARELILAAAVSLLPISVEEKVGAVGAAQLRAQYTEIDDPAVQNDIQAILDRVLEGVDNPGYSFQVTVVKSDQINALALPGGQIFVFSGLIENADSAEQIAGVLAHEIAHVTERHGMTQLVRSAGVTTAVLMLFGDSSGMLLLADLGTRLTSLQHSRDDEREADRVGLATLKKARLDPQGLADFLRMLEHPEHEGLEQQIQSNVSKAVPEWLSTHPATRERITELEANLSHNEGFEPLELDLEKLKQAVRGQ